MGAVAYGPKLCECLVCVFVFPIYINKVVLKFTDVPCEVFLLSNGRYVTSNKRMEFLLKQFIYTSFLIQRCLRPCVEAYFISGQFVFVCHRV